MELFYPVRIFTEWLVYKALLIPPHTLLAEVVGFFIYDTIKIFLLLIGIIFSVSIIRSFLSPDKIRGILTHKNKYAGNVLAALFGIITPFCTCSAIPLFLGFIEAGVPLGVTFSFLVSSPMVNEVALVLLLGMFGLKIALIYAVSGVVIAFLAGVIIDRLKPENLINQITSKSLLNSPLMNFKMTWPERIGYARGYTFGIVKAVWPYIIIGIGLGAFMHGYVPSGLLAKYAGAGKWYAVPLATIIGIPLYSNAAGIIPLVSVLTEKGVSMGTSLAFMMAVTGLSLPEFLILKRVMKVRLLLIFAAVVGIGIIFTGYLFNFILK